MDTQEARLEMRDMASDALAIVERVVAGNTPTTEERSQLRRYASDARSLLGDAGYPGEAAWHAMQRASIDVDTLTDQPDRSFWMDVEAELRRALETLTSLVSVYRREADVHIVG